MQLLFLEAFLLSSDFIVYYLWKTILIALNVFENTPIYFLLSFTCKSSNLCYFSSPFKTSKACLCYNDDGSIYILSTLW